MRRLLTPLSLVLLLSCGGDEPDRTACGALCTELVDACASGAYPDMESCMNGCAVQADEGTNVEAYATCVTDAACDPFGIVDCEDAHGS